MSSDFPPQSSYLVSVTRRVPRPTHFWNRLSGCPFGGSVLGENGRRPASASVRRVRVCPRYQKTSWGRVLSWGRSRGSRRHRRGITDPSFHERRRVFSLSESPPLWSKIRVGVEIWPTLLWSSFSGLESQGNLVPVVEGTVVDKGS